ncbi:MAG TPA: DUF559 domain-containing protein, partial [Acidimicrobiales bacterium]|nr:DUF559 domain-containing protein [Acidimicrobiales bacterium]
PGVFVMPGTKATDLQRLMAAVMASGDGAVASHRSAAWLWDLTDDLFLEVTVPRVRRARLPGVVVHRPVDYRSTRHSVRHGIAATNPLRTLCDLGAVVPADVLELAVERALIARLVSVRGLRTAAAHTRTRGRRGPSVLAGVLDGRALTDRPPDSVFESRVAAFFRRHGLPRAVYQHPVQEDGRFLARVDFAYPEWRLAIEFDGHDSHRTPAQLQRDLTRQNVLVTGGWTVLRFTWADVVERPEMVAATIRSQLAKLQAA